MSKEPLIARGYRIIRTISDTGRNRTHEVERGGQRFFAKINLSKDPQMIANDVWWCQTIQRLGASLPFRAPQVIEHGEDWLVEELIHGELLAPSTSTDQQLMPIVGFLVESLLALDQLKIDEVRIDHTDTAPATDLIKKVDEWTERPLVTGLISSERLEEAKALIRRHQPYVEPALQHGDFVPWHFFAANKPVLFDGEHAGPHKARYYDLAYLYSRIYTRLGATKTASALLDGFLRQHADPKFEQAFLPVITQRALGMHNDAINDLAIRDYRLAATELLDRCLARDLKALL